MEELFGGWSIDKECFDFIRSHLPDGSTLLEFGSGQVTDELSKHYKVYSVEHNINFMNKRNTNYLYAPINGGSWYNRTILQEELPKISYDMVLIDGPDHAFRKGILDNLDLIDWSKTIVIDDLQENDLMELSRRLSSHIGRELKTVQCDGPKDKKIFGVI